MKSTSTAHTCIAFTVSAVASIRTHEVEVGWVIVLGYNI